MANEARGEVELKLGGKIYLLRPTFGAVAEIEEAIETNLYDIGQRLERAQITARELVKFAHACLRHCGHAVENERLGETIVAEGTHKTILALTEFCRNYAFGGAPQKKAGAPPETEPSKIPRPTSGNT
ncbi:MAG: gene transfer agent family protein [Kiloniellaceae bacterium]